MCCWSSSQISYCLKASGRDTPLQAAIKMAAARAEAQRQAQLQAAQQQNRQNFLAGTSTASALQSSP